MRDVRSVKCVTIPCGGSCDDKEELRRATSTWYVHSRVFCDLVCNLRAHSVLERDISSLEFNFPILTFEKKRCFSISWQSETSKCSDNFHVSDVVVFWRIVWRVVHRIVRDSSDEEMLRLWRLGDFIRGWVRRWQNQRCDS